MIAQTSQRDEPQVSFFEMEREQRQKEAVPKLTKGQRVFVLSLDVVLIGTIGRSWLCGSDNFYFGYDVDFDNGSHNVIWDYCIGKTVFTDPLEVEIMANEISRKMVKMHPTDIGAHDARAFQYRRNCDSRNISAIVAKVGETKLYEKGFCCYHFLHTYPTKQERDKAYKVTLDKMLAESNYAGGEESEPQYETLYRVTDYLYASREYAQNHGAEYAEYRRRI